MNNFTLFNEELAQALAMTMVHSLWQGAIIVVLITLILKGRLGEQARNQYLVHFAGLGSLFFVAVLTFCYQYSIPFSPSELTFTAQSSTDGLASDVNHVSNRYGFDWKYILSLVWLTGALFFVIRLLASSLHLVHIRRTSQVAALEWQQCVRRLQSKLKIGHQVKLLISDLSPVPFIYGILKPVIIVPSMYFNQLTDREIESIILHELAHIRRNDFAINLVSVIIESLLFFNPATWWLTKEMKTQREFCCDDTVQQQIGNRNIYLRALYKAALLSIDNQPNYSVALFHQNSELIMRVKRMLNTPGHRSGHFPFVTAGIGILLLGLLFTAHLAIGQNSEQKHNDRQTLDQVEVKEVIAIQPAIAPMVKVNVEVANPVVVSAAPVAPVVTAAAQPVIVNKVAISPAPIIHITTPVIEPVIHITKDTLPTSPKMEELKRKLEQKAEEMEELAELLEESIEDNVENEMEKMEELMEQLEDVHEEEMEKFEEMENSEAMERLEDLAEELEEAMEEYEEVIEESFPEEVIESIAEEMERTAEAYETDEPLSEEQRKKLEAEMKVLKEKMQEAMQGYEVKMRDMQRDPDIERIQKEMEAVGREIKPMTQKHENLWTEDAKRLQEEIHLIQQNMHLKMQSTNLDIQKKMEQKAAEMSAISREMEEEAKRLKNKGNQ